MKTLAAAIFFGIVVYSAAHVCGMYLAGGYQVDRQLAQIEKQMQAPFLPGPRSRKS
jgi:hypothetical protein